MSEVIPEGWSRDELTKYCDVVGGGTPDRSIKEYWGGDIPWISPTEVTSKTTRFISNTKERITQLGLERSSAKLHPVRSLLMTSRASIGYVAINTVPMATNQGFQTLRCKKETLCEYLYYYIDFIRPELERISAGSTFSEIPSSSIKKLEITLPPFPEQQKIAAILSSVDDVIEKTRAQIDKLKDLKTAMMQELLTQGIGHTEFKDSPVGRMPEEWVTDRLDNLGTNHQPVLRTGPFGSSLKSEDFRTSGIPVINIQNLGIGRLERDSVYFITKEKAQELGGYAVSKDDLVFSRVADVGRSVVIPDYAHGWIMSSNLMRISVDRTRIHPKYLMYQLVNGPAVTHQIKQVVADGGRPVITGSLIRSLIFPLPSIEEQFSIVQKIDSVDGYLMKAGAALNQLTSLKKSLLQDLLTGKVRVKLDQPETTAA